MSTAKLDEDKLYVSVGKLIRTRRELLKMTQAKLAALVGLERTSITNIENGTQRLPLHVFYAVCAALDMKIEAALPKLADVSTSINSETVTYGDQEFKVTPKAQMIIEKLAAEMA